MSSLHDEDGGRRDEWEEVGVSGDEQLPWLTAYSDDFLVDMGSHAESSEGRAYLVGAGPGDPTLLTIRARLLLDACDVLVHDAGVSAAMLRRSDPARPPAALRQVGSPAAGPGRESTSRIVTSGTNTSGTNTSGVGTSGSGAGEVAPEDVGALLVRLAREGRRVVRLAIGDPFSLGAGGAEAEALAEAGVPFEVVPGVLPELAAAAWAGIPTTHAGLSTSVTLAAVGVDGMDLDPDWTVLAAAGGTLALRVEWSALRRVARRLVSAGIAAEMPAVVVPRGALAGEPVLTSTLGELAALADGGATGPATLILGWAVVLRDELAWVERRPLHGRRVLVARSGRGAGLAARVREEGAEVLELPPARPEQLDPAQLREALQWLDQYDWLVFADAHSARVFWEELREAGRDARALAGCRLATLGWPAGDQLLAHGLAADVVAEDVEALLEAVGADDESAGGRVLWLGPEGALGGELHEGLEASGALVEAIPLYHPVADLQAGAALREALAGPAVDAALLPDPAAVLTLVGLLGADAARAIPVVAGVGAPELARELGLRLLGASATPDPAALVTALVEALASQP